MVLLDNLKLGELFSSGQTIAANLEDSDLPSNDSKYQLEVANGIERLKRANDLINSLHIFSENESIDEINSNDLRFLLTPAYLGDLTLKISGKDINRGDILNESKEYFSQFLERCQYYELMKKDESTEMELLQNKKTSSVSTAQTREKRIARFKYEKSIKEKLKELRNKINQASDNKDDDCDIDQIEHEWVNNLIQLEIQRSLDSWQAIEQELVMVKEMEEARERIEKMGIKAGSSADSNPITSSQHNWGKDKPMLNKEGRPLQPFVIMSNREKLKNQVFGYGHNLPTMTIDEYLEQEEERGNIIKGGGEPPEKPEISDNDYDALDAEIMKKRDWDEFVEANPRGAGNRGNKG